MAKILIADDDLEIVELLKTLMTKEGFNTIEVTRGSDVVDTAKKEKPDLIILDVMMPGMDGYTVQLHLSQNTETHDIPVFVLSAYSSSEGLFNIFGSVKYFIKKPFDTKDLIKKIKEFVK